MTDLNPFNRAEQDAQRWAIRQWHRLQDVAKTYTTVTLLKLLGAVVLAAVLAALNLPGVAIGVVGVVIAALVIYAIYATKIMKEQDRELRWAYVQGKRVQQAKLREQIATDSVTLALLGVRPLSGSMRGATSELRAALAFRDGQLRAAQLRADAADAERAGALTDAQRRALRRSDNRQPAAPKPPAPEPIKARRDAREAEDQQLEAEIQSLAGADSIAEAMRAEEVAGARRSARERRDLSRKADQAARDRKRAGRSATAPRAEHAVSLRLSPNGARDVSVGRGPATPEQIAARGTEADAA